MEKLKSRKEILDKYREERSKCAKWTRVMLSDPTAVLVVGQEK